MTARATNRLPLRMPQAPRQLLLLFALLYPFASAGTSLTALCDRQPSACFALLDEKQRDLPTGSPAWWELETVRLHSLFKFQKIDELYVALRPWIDNPDVPADYQPVVAMMYGKWLGIRGRNNESASMLEQALDGFRRLEQQNESIPLALTILNILVILNRFEEAKTYAADLVDDNYDSPVFYREVFAELAHIAHKTDERQAHVDYRRESVRWAEKIPDEQQKAVAYNNYGVALRINEQYQEAERAFLAGVKFAKQAGDSTQVNKLTLRRAEVAFLMRDLNAAQSFLNRIDLSHFPPGQVAKYRELASKVLATRHGKQP